LALLVVWEAPAAFAQTPPETPPAEEQSEEPEEAPAEEGKAEAAPSEGQAAEPATAAPPVEAPAAAAEASSEVVITGSRIKRTSFAQPSAVEVIDRKALTKTGARNLGDIVRQMDINYGSDVNTDVSSAAGGTSQFNLRGLGLSSTLVLLNGRRLVQAGTASLEGESFVDINSIPLAAVERIEVLKGGASAIYGSDAVAGVVNIITRKQFNGFEGHIGGSTTSKFDQQDWEVSLLGGASTEHTRVLGMVSYYGSNPLQAPERDFTSKGSNVSTLGWPSAYLPLVPPPMRNAAGKFENGYRDPGCGMVPLSAPVPNWETDATSALPFCTFNFNPYFDLILKSQRVNTYAKVEQDVGDHVTLFFEGAYAGSRVQRRQSPSYPILQTVVVPADHQYNPLGVPLRWFGRPLAGNAPPALYYTDSDTLHTAAGIKGDLGAASGAKLSQWDWILQGTWGRNRFHNELYDTLKAPLQNALNSCTPTTDPAECWNPFYSGPPNSQYIINKVTGALNSEVYSELTTASLDLSGPIATLPGGDLALAFGGQLRRESIVSNQDHDSEQENYLFLIGSPDYSADRKIGAVYGELSIPLVSGMEVQAAGRFEHYSDVGGSFNPMAGVSWTPAQTFIGDDAPLISQVRVRGTIATSFRAPSLLQTYGVQTALEPIYPYTTDSMGNVSAAGSAVYNAVRTYGNPNLKPQQATAITAGLEWEPLQALRFIGDYWRYDYQDYIVKESAQQIVAADADCNVTPATCDPRITRDPAGSPTRIDARFVNAAAVKTHGIDAALTYRSDFGAHAGLFAFGLSGTYVLSFEIPESQVIPSLRDENFISCNGKYCDVAGLRNGVNFARSIPRLRSTASIGWGLGGHTANITAHFISGYKDDADVDPGPAEHYNNIDAFVSLDLQYGFRLDEGDGTATTFRIGVTNLFDTPPPFVKANFGYDPTIHDPRGRVLYARLVQEL
jgi:iron complex outermembrane receptor protein